MVSIITPVYNNTYYLEDCIRSVLSQEESDWELIIIDDGSVDNPLSVAEPYILHDRRISFHRFDNEGLPTARNHGLDYAKGDFILFLDSDDMLLPKALSTLMQVQSETKGDIVIGKTIRKSNSLKENAYGGFYEFTPQEALKEALYQKGLTTSVCGNIYKKALFDNLRFTPRILYEDLDIFYHIFERAKKIVMIEIPVYFYRKTPGSLLHRWCRERHDVLDVTRRLEDYIALNFPQIVNAAKDRRFSANFNMLILGIQNRDPIRRKECIRLIRDYRKGILMDRNSRIKNKVGALISYLLF